MHSFVVFRSKCARIFHVLLFNPMTLALHRTFDGSCYSKLPGSLFWTTDYAYRSDIDDMDRYVNCAIATGRSKSIGKRVLGDDAILSVIRQWRASQPVTSENYVCQACWDLAQDVVLGRRAIDAPTQVGFSSVCVRCGRSLLAQRYSHLLRIEDE